MKRRVLSIVDKTISVFINFFTLAYYSYVKGNVHRNMTFKQKPDVVVRISWFDLSKLLHAKKWMWYNEWPESLFIGRGTDNEIHASIIKIDGIHYITSSFGLLMTDIFISRITSNIEGIDWDTEKPITKPLIINYQP